jgi:hypothetical protein
LLAQQWGWGDKTTKLLVDGLLTKINLLRQELRVFVYPSGPDLSTSALRLLGRELAARRRRIGKQDGTEVFREGFLSVYSAYG